MKAFIECAAGSTTRRNYDEFSYELKRESEVSAAYPYAYGFIVDTATSDEDALDCYVISGTEIAHGSFVNCVPLCTLEFNEGTELDYKVFVRLEGEKTEADEAAIAVVKRFITEIFKKFPEVSISFGKILNKKDTLDLIDHRKKKALRR